MQIRELHLLWLPPPVIFFPQFPTTVTSQASVNAAIFEF